MNKTRIRGSKNLKEESVESGELKYLIRRPINPKYRKLVEVMQNERFGLSRRGEFLSLIRLSKKIWKSAIKQLRQYERVLNLPYPLNNTSKTYALDGLVIARSIGIPDKDTFLPLQIFSLYYLSIHIVDDLIEDQKKFYRQFGFNHKYKLSKETGKEILPLSYTLSVLLNIHELFLADSRHWKNRDKLFQALLTSLGKFIRFFIIERTKLSPEIVLRIKAREVAGIATSMIAELLSLDKLFGRQKFLSIKKALYYLGSLTQFTDDIRDYTVDKKIGNANLLLSLEQKFGKNAQDKFKQWYAREETKMLSALKSSGLKMNTNLIRLIPWYPFWMK